MTATDASLAANRFGLGARPGEIARLGGDARGALAAQLAGPPPLIQRPLPSAAELLAQAMALREAQRRGGGDAGAQVKVAMQVRELYRPAYVGESLARFDAAVASERSFVERLVQFWSNHFAVSIDKALVLGLAGPMEREAIRPHVLGSFPELLRAVEQHPAMLLYLDNHASIGPHSRAALAVGRRSRGRRELGLNENLGREILELHTLGVDGGYTQQDVTTLAAILTGWSVGGNAGRLRGGAPGQFFFREEFHEPGTLGLLGRSYRDAGVAQGERALHDLALHPKTAHHLATKLARHFIADEPPAAVVEPVARAFRDSQGDLPTVYRALLDTPQAWNPAPAKYKTPADYVHSTYRALALPVGTERRALAPFELLGQRCFQPGSPAGWPDRSADWDGSSALLKRIEWANALGQRLGSRVDALAVADAALGASLGEATRTSLARAQDGAQALTLLLASADFMRR